MLERAGEACETILIEHLSGCRRRGLAIAQELRHAPHPNAAVIPQWGLTKHALVDLVSASIARALARAKVGDSFFPGPCPCSAEAYCCASEPIRG